MKNQSTQKLDSYISYLNQNWGDGQIFKGYQTHYKYFTEVRCEIKYNCFCLSVEIFQIEKNSHFDN